MARPQSGETGPEAADIVRAAFAALPGGGTLRPSDIESAYREAHDNFPITPAHLRGTMRKMAEATPVELVVVEGPGVKQGTYRLPTVAEVEASKAKGRRTRADFYEEAIRKGHLPADSDAAFLMVVRGPHGPILGYEASGRIVRLGNPLFVDVDASSGTPGAPSS